MRIRKMWKNIIDGFSITPLPPPPPPPPLPPSDLVSSTSLSQPPWLQILQHSPPIMISRLNVRHPVTSTVAEAAARSTIVEKSGSSSVHGDSISTKTSTASSVSSSLSRHGQWCEEEKAFPLKKRRVSLERFIIQECDESKNKKMIKGLFKKCSTSSRTKIKVDEMTINEGDMGLRCTRRNGSGWRCKNQQVKGSAWCDHHIKQSRTRDGKPPKQAASIPNHASIHHVKYGGGGGGGDFGVVGKKRKRVRRISSILKQPKNGY